MLLKVEGGQFVKDTKNNALLAVNPVALQENEARKRLSQSLNSKDTEINKLKERMEGLTNDLSEIKFLLKQLIKN